MTAVFCGAAQADADLDAKIAKWSPVFIPVCENFIKPKVKKAKVATYCQCVISKHKEYIIGKQADDPVNVDEHLAELLQTYSSGGKVVPIEVGEPTMTELAAELSTDCFKAARQK
jgi:hypothetical protein